MINPHKNLNVVSGRLSRFPISLHSLCYVEHANMARGDDRDAHPTSRSNFFHFPGVFG